MKTILKMILITCCGSVYIPAQAASSPDNPQVAECQALSKKTANEKTYQVCKAALASLEGQEGTESEVNVLLALGLTTGYIHNDENLQYYERAIKSAEKAYGPESHKTLEPIINTAYILHDEKRPTEAIPYFERAIKLAIVSPEKADKEGALLYYDRLVLLLLEVNRHADALDLARQYVQYAETTFGDSHEDTASAWTRAGKVEMQSGNLELARNHFAKALEFWESKGYPGFIRGAKEKLDRVEALISQSKTK
jgi:tetratricopeptide (TPR) repeat protein